MITRTIKTIGIGSLTLLTIGGIVTTILALTNFDFRFTLAIIFGIVLFVVASYYIGEFIKLMLKQQ